MNDMGAERMVAGVKTGVSFKDTFLSKGGRSDVNTMLEEIAGQKVDFEILEGDLTIRDENGMPTIDFSTRVHRFLA